MGNPAGVLYFAPLLFLGLLLAVALVVALLAHRFLKWSRIVSAVLGFGVAIALGGYSYWFLVTNLPTTGDHDDAQRVAKIVRAAYPFGSERSAGPVFNFRPHPRRTEFIVYGVVDAAEQDKIVEITRRARAAASNKPIILTFKPEAKFKGHPSGIQSRIVEDPIRVERIDN